MILTIREWRRLRNVTQSQMAVKLGVTLPTISKWERFPEKIPLKKVAEIADFLGITLNDIKI